MNISKSIILTGIKHCGKSTQGRLLSKSLSLDFYDTDDVIHELTGKQPREIYNTEGKDSFLSAEKLACLHLNSIIKTKPVIISTGGGICDNEEALHLLNCQSLFVFLQISEDDAFLRIINEASTDGENILDQNTLPSYIAKKNPRTISDARNIFHNFYSERTQKYSVLADFSIDQKNLSPEKVCNKIIEFIQKN